MTKCIKLGLIANMHNAVHQCIHIKGHSIVSPEFPKLSYIITAPFSHVNIYNIENKMRISHIENEHISH